jgi:hypothetical protein
MVNSKDKRIRVTDRELHLIVKALRHTLSGRHTPERALELQKLAERLEENRPGNPSTYTILPLEVSA